MTNLSFFFIVTTARIGAVVMGLGQASAGQAHARWVIPSHTVVSGDKPMSVAFDYSISNDLFHPDIALGGDERVGPLAASKPSPAARPAGAYASVTKPDGSLQKLHSVDLKRKSSSFFVADVPGTYRVDIHQTPTEFTRYIGADGETQRLFGPPQQNRARLPTQARSITQLTYINRIQTFVTHNKTNLKTVKPTGSGLELRHFTHPNALFASERSDFALVMDGKPLSQHGHVTITRGDTRFRNQRNSLHPEISDQGHFSVTWPEAGFYLLEVEHEIHEKNTTIIHALFLTLEVQPE